MTAREYDSVRYCPDCDDGPTMDCERDAMVCEHCLGEMESAYVCETCDNALAVCDDQCVDCVVASYVTGPESFEADMTDSYWNEPHWRDAWWRIATAKMDRIESDLRGAAEACARAVT